MNILQKWTFRELKHDGRGMGWVDCDGTDIAATGAMTLTTAENLKIGHMAEAAPELYAALKSLFDLIDNGRLVRDISHDHEEGWAMKQLDIVMALQKSQAALAKVDRA